MRLGYRVASIALLGAALTVGAVAILPAGSPPPAPLAAQAPTAGWSEPPDDMTPATPQPSRPPTATVPARSPRPVQPPRPPTQCRRDVWPVDDRARETATSGTSPAMDAGRLVIWGPPDGRPPYWLLAGHNTMGWSWIRSIPTGCLVVVHGTAAAGTYRVTGHASVRNTGSTPYPPFAADLALQTCIGDGTYVGFTLTRRVG